MLKPLLSVLAIGAGIGVLWPDGHGSPAAQPAQDRPAAAASTGAPSRTSSVPQQTLLKRAPGGHFFADVAVNGQPVHVVVDTGATDVALTIEDARRIGVPFSESEFQVVGEGASGPIRGKIVTLASVDLDGKEVRDVRAAVLEGLPVSLLGQAYLSHVTIGISGDTMQLD